MFNGAGAMRIERGAPRVRRDKDGTKLSSPECSRSGAANGEGFPGTRGEHPRACTPAATPTAEARKKSALSEAADQTMRGDAGCCVSFVYR